MEIKVMAGTNRKAGRKNRCRTIINPEYDGEPALQSRRLASAHYIVIEGSSGATEGVLDPGVLRCPVVEYGLGWMGRIRSS